MPDIGFLELLLVGVIAFLVLGPERMPELFGQAGRAVKKGREWYADVRRKIDAETQLESTVADVKSSLNAADIDDWNRQVLAREQAEQAAAAEKAESEVGNTNESADKQGKA